MTDFNLATADQAQLKAYAKNELDLSLSMAMSAQTMREKIAKFCNDNGLEAPAASIEIKIQPGKEAVVLITINIAKQDKPQGSDPIFVGVQGVGYMVPRGINVDVSPAIVEVLNNAIQDFVTQDPDTGEILHEPVQTYPFQIVQKAAA